MILQSAGNFSLYESTIQSRETIGPLQFSIIMDFKY